MKRKQSKESLRRIEEGKIRFINNLGTEYILMSEYETAKTHVTIKHCECKMEYKVRPDNFNSGICLIEFQGEQHYNYSEFFYKNMEKYKESQLKDRIKREYCKNNNIRLLEIPYWDIDNIKTILDDYLSNIV